jgi:cell division protein FtsI (penicillin-binding protein 3)
MRSAEFSKTHRLRLVLLVVLMMGAFAGIEARLFMLQVTEHKAWSARAEYQQHKKELLSPRRGEILDRNGALLASSHFTKTVILNTHHAPRNPSSRLVGEFAAALGEPRDRVQTWFNEPGRYYVYRKAPESVVQAVAGIASRHNLPDPMVELEDTGKRDYPNGPLASHIIGFTTIDEHGSDNIGIEGIERRFDDWLAGHYREVRLQVTSGLRRRGLHAMDEQTIEETFGHDLVLTVDQRVQSIAERALASTVGRFQARAGVAVVMDVATGEILALANCPDFDPNTFRDHRTDKQQLRNRALTDPIEVGSVMKIVTTALLLDRNVLSTDESIDCQGGSAWIGGRTIRDAHRLDVVPFHVAFAHSSNIAMASLADTRLEPGDYHEGLTRFGLGQTTGIDLPGEGRGVLRPVGQWTAMTKASLAFGYETSLTPLQVVSALGAIGNNGWRMRPHLVREIRNSKGETIRRFRPEPLGRVAGAETCRTMLQLMEDVVLVGTAKKEGGVPGYRAGGKTGTTVKHERDEDGDKRYIASFAGLVPIDQPRLAIYVYVDEPQGAKFGGEVAAPIFREIAEQSLPLLGVPPSDPREYQEALIASQPPSADNLPAGPDSTAASPHAAAGASPILPPAQPSTRPALPGLETAPPSPVTGPPMPDCLGLTMIQTWDKLGKSRIDARLLGSGLAVSQEPPPGRRIVAGQTAKVIFSNATAPPPTQKSNPLPAKVSLR